MARIARASTERPLSVKQQDNEGRKTMKTWKGVKKPLIVPFSVLARKHDDDEEGKSCFMKQAS